MQGVCMHIYMYNILVFNKSTRKYYFILNIKYLLVQLSLGCVLVGKQCNTYFLLGRDVQKGKLLKARVELHSTVCLFKVHPQTHHLHPRYFIHTVYLKNISHSSK